MILIVPALETFHNDLLVPCRIRPPCTLCGITDLPRPDSVFIDVISVVDSAHRLKRLRPGLGLVPPSNKDGPMSRPLSHIRIPQTGSLTEPSGLGLAEVVQRIHSAV